VVGFAVCALAASGQRAAEVARRVAARSREGRGMRAGPSILA